MTIDDAMSLVRTAIRDAAPNIGEVADDMPLIGGDSPIDSMKLVEICLALEDAADAHGFEFDWTSEAAMSRSRSMFRTVRSLAEALVAQSGAAA